MNPSFSFLALPLALVVGCTADATPSKAQLIQQFGNELGTAFDVLSQARDRKTAEAAAVEVGPNFDRLEALLAALHQFGSPREIASEIDRAFPDLGSRGATFFNTFARNREVAQVMAPIMTRLRGLSP